jgi:iron complex transport system substrate-binding protein
MPLSEVSQVAFPHGERPAFGGGATPLRTVVSSTKEEIDMSHRFLVVLLVFGLFVAACGGGADAQDSTASTTPTTSGGAFPVTVDAANGAVTIDRRPERIVSISPTSTEDLFAIGAGSQVVAVDDRSDHPAGAPVTGLSGFDASAEAIASFDPDLVVLSFDPGDLIAGLETLGIPAILHPAATAISDVYTQIEQLGVATGNAAEAENVVTGMRTDIEGIVAALPDLAAAPVYYHELDPSYYTATSATFVGEIYGLLGMVNLADPADPDGSGYPQLSGEYVLDEDPDLIFLADTKCCGQTPETVAERPGWDELTAVTHGRVIPLDDDVASRWGPRIVELLGDIAAAVDEMAESST